MDTEARFEKYLALLSSVKGVSVEYTNDNGYRQVILKGANANSLTVHLELATIDNGYELLTLTIDGVDLVDGNSMELKDDEWWEPYLTIATSALTGDVVFQRSPILRKKEGCFVYGNAWICVPVSQWFSTYTVRKKVQSQ